MEEYVKWKWAEKFEEDDGKLCDYILLSRLIKISNLESVYNLP